MSMSEGRFVAYDAKTGQKLWESPTGTGVIAAPSSYLVDDKQYISIAVDWGGAYVHAQRNTERKGPGTIYTFAVGGKAPRPAFLDYNLGELVSGVKYDPTKIPAGTDLYVSNCVLCHGVPGVDRGGNTPNLGYMNSAYIENLDKFVFKGAAMSRGMPDFTGKLSMEDVEKIKAFIQGTADAIRPKK
jgi:quinohemoprotein ethanol dehydrogenase